MGKIVFYYPWKQASLPRKVNADRTICPKKHLDFVECDSNVVYSVPFTCGAEYIGQTGRCLNQRLAEHADETRDLENSNLKLHLLECVCEPDFAGSSVLGRHSTMTGREILEAFFIRKRGAVSSPNVTLLDEKVRCLETEL